MLPMFAGRTGFDHPPTQAVRADSVLYDVGSGFGRFASFLRAHTNASRVVGIEVNSCRARQESGLYCSYGGVETLPEAAQGLEPSTAFFHCSRASRRGRTPHVSEACIAAGCSPRHVRYGLQAARLPSISRLELRRGDVRRLGFADATHVFVTAQCWGEDLLRTLFGRL